MYKEGDLIIYGGDGVCKVLSIGPAPFASLDQTRQYYTLAPLYRAGENTFDDLMERPPRKALFEKYGMYQQFPQPKKAVGIVVYAIFRC